MNAHLLSLSPKAFCDATDPCSEGAKFALKQKTMTEVWDNCPRVDWLCWILNQLEVPADEKAVRLYMVWCARNTPLADGRTTGALLTHPDSLAALAVAERFALGNATADELSAARSAAWSAVWSAAESAARSVAWSAAESAALVVHEHDLQRLAAESAAWSAAESAARSAARSAAWSAARSAAWSAARSAARSAQAAEFRRVVANPFKEGAA